MATEAIPSTGTNAPEAPAPEPQSPEAADEARIQKYAKQAVLAATESADADTAALEQARGEDGADKARDPETGKFLPKKKEKNAAKPKVAANGRVAEAAGKAEPAAVKEPAEGSEADKQTPEFAGGLGKARRLFKEGKIAEGMKLVGLDPERVPNGMWVALRKETDKREAQILSAHAKVEEQREEVKREARELVAQLRPFAEAQQALQSGDEDKVFELIFGKTVDEWQRERLGRMHRGDLRKDPVVSEFAKKLEAEKAERIKLQRLLEERDAQAQQREEQAAIERRQGEYREELKGQFESSGDARLQRAASLPWFVKAVHDEQLKSYKFDTDTRQEDYLTVDEAIERVYDKRRLTAAQWEELTDGLASSEKRDPGTLNQVASVRRGSDVKRAAKAPTTLSRSEAADPTHRPEMDDEQRLAYYANLHARNIANG
jgi:hypothetical protein